MARPHRGGIGITAPQIDQDLERPMPGPTDAFGAVNIVARLGEGGVTVTQEPLPQMPAELAALFEED